MGSGLLNTFVIFAKQIFIPFVVLPRFRFAHVLPGGQRPRAAARDCEGLRETDRELEWS